MVFASLLDGCTTDPAGFAPVFDAPVCVEVGAATCELLGAVVVSVDPEGFGPAKGFGIFAVTASNAGGLPIEAIWTCRDANFSRAPTYSVCHLSRSSSSRATARRMLRTSSFNAQALYARPLS